MNKCIRVLHVVPELNVGGIETMLYNYYYNTDREKINFDFIVHGSNIGHIERKFTELGSIVFHITPKRVALRKHLREMSRVIYEHEYDIIHVHQNLLSFIPLYIGKRKGIEVRIAHAHGNNNRISIINRVINNLFSLLVRKYANHYFACGVDAGRWVYGEKKVKDGAVFILKNAIDLDKFKFSNECRSNIRKEMNLEDKKIIAQIGRFTYEKNHNFTVEVFREITKTNNDIELFFIGDGELKEEIEKKVINDHLKDGVRFIGNSSNVHELLSAIDILLLPSLHEGLPLTPIEAQATGLKCIVSSRVTEEVKVTELVEFLSIDDSPVIWAKKIIGSFYENERESEQEKMLQAGYDIKQAARCLQSEYQKMVLSEEKEEFLYE